VQTKKEGNYKIQIFGIDSPELEQSFGIEAMMFLEKLLLNKKVEVELQGKDRWGNRLGVVRASGNLDPRVELLKEGLAWTAERNPLPDLELIKEQAKANNKGLWQEENPVPPWQFRRNQSMLQPKMS
jgi:endonuclease YncB( thermonuclease family)